jgi:endo-1,4-beta-xylanase
MNTIWKTTVKTQTLVLVATILVGASEHATAQLPENYLKRWDDPAVQKRINDGIERNRQSDVQLRIVDSHGSPLRNADVHITQTSHEFLFGCNLFVIGQMQEKEEAYEAAFLKLFNFATIPFYWDALEPQPGELRFQEGSAFIWRRPPPDRAVAFGKQHGLTLKGHPLLWSNMTHNPSWLPQNADKLRRLYLRRFQEIAGRYAEDIPIWDGVNESLVAGADFPLYSKEKRLDPPFVRWAFAAQQTIFRPDNQLMINDVTTFNWPANASNRYFRQCSQLLADGVPIEGIGFQFHFFDRKSLDQYLNSERCDPNTLLDSYEMFAKLKLPLWITEITIGSAGDDGPSIQQRVVRDIYRLWFASPRMAGITWWNLGDGTAYGNEGAAGGGLADEEFNAKPAYQALNQLINHDWKTNISTTTDAHGAIAFRGFHGGYDVQVKHRGKTQRFRLAVSSEGSNSEMLTLR